MDKFKEKIIEFLNDKANNKTNDKTNIAKIDLEIPPNPDMGDFAFPCFALSKELKKNPNQIAIELAEKFRPNEYISEVKVLGPYLNFYMAQDKLAEVVIKDIIEKKDDYGKGEKKKERIMVEYCQVNTHKAFHVGHFRGTLIGSTLIKILRFLGYDVISANYQGDIGAHVAKSIWFLKNHYHGEYPKENKGKWLGQIYHKANSMLANASGRNKEKYDEEISNILQGLENREPNLTELWQMTRQWSLDDFEEFYKIIGIQFDEYFFESEMEKPGKEIVDELMKSNLAQKSEGAILIDFEKYGLGKFLVLKSDGTTLYSTKDLALAKIKFEKFAIDKSIYVVGSEQKFYFQQLFKALEIMGFENAKNCVHIPYDLITLEGGKISSREGKLIYADDLYDDVFDFAIGEVRKRHDNWDKERIIVSAKNIALSSIKFGIVNQDNNKSIVFNPEKAMDFEGETGPYVQYAHARICSIIRKYGKELEYDIDYALLNHETEKHLLTMLGNFPNKMKEAGELYRTYLICQYLIKLSQGFTEFYHKCPILTAEPELMKARLVLAECVRQVLNIGLNILGIEAPEEM